jgi:hypothetical protein
VPLTVGSIACPGAMLCGKTEFVLAQSTEIADKEITDGHSRVRRFIVSSCGLRTPNTTSLDPQSYNE